MQTCPGFFSKSLLESPGNLLEICSVKFVDTLLKTKVQLKLFGVIAALLTNLAILALLNTVYSS